MTTSLRYMALLLICLFTPAAVIAEATPINDMQSTVNSLVEVVEMYPGDDNLTTRRAELRKIIAPKFDFNEMAKRSLGAQWLKIDEQQQAQFVSVFSELLAKTYLARIENVERNMVTVDSEKISESTSSKLSKALVKTTVSYKGDQFPIDYKLFRREQQTWKVYDVVIENIGLVSNYRNEFAGIIRRHNFDGLIERLQKKIAS